MTDPASLGLSGLPTAWEDLAQFLSARSSDTLKAHRWQTFVQNQADEGRVLPSPGWTGGDGWLHRAVRHQHWGLALAFVEAGADVNAHNGRGSVLDHLLAEVLPVNPEGVPVPFGDYPHLEGFGWSVASLRVFEAMLDHGLVLQAQPSEDVEVLLSLVQALAYETRAFMRPALEDVLRLSAEHGHRDAWHHVRSEPSKRGVMTVWSSLEASRSPIQHLDHYDFTDLGDRVRAALDHHDLSRIDLPSPSPGRASARL